MIAKTLKSMYWPFSRLEKEEARIVQTGDRAGSAPTRHNSKEYNDFRHPLNAG